MMEALTRYCTELQATLPYVTTGSFGSLADMKLSHSHSHSQSNGALSNVNDPRNQLASLLKINYEDILQIVRERNILQLQLIVHSSYFVLCSYTHQELS